MATISSFRFQGKTRDSYLECIRNFPLTTISSHEHLATAQEVMDKLLAIGKLDRGQYAYLDALSDLVASYEEQHFPIAPPSDADMLQHLLDAKGLTQADLHREAGIAKSSISEILAGKKKFSRQLIHKLAKFFKVHPGVLAGNL